MACCMGAKYDNWCDDVEIVWTDPETGDEYCLFHAPAGHKEMDENKILDYIQEQSEGSESIIDLRGSIFTSPLTLSTYCINELKLNSCQFHEQVIFLSIKVKNDTEIANCIFHKRVKVIYSHFLDSLVIRNSHFNNDIYLNQISCSNKLALQAIECPKILSIIPGCSTQSLTVSLKESGKIKISSNINRKAIKELSIITQYPNSTSRVDINNLEIGEVKLHNSHNVQTHITNCSIHKFTTSRLNLTEPLMFESCTFNDVSLRAFHLKFIEFIGCSFPKENGRSSVKAPTHDYQLTGKKIDTLRDREYLARQLKKVAQNNEDRLLASDWHYWEKFFMQARLKEEHAWIEFTVLWIYYTLSEYGESVKKAGGWLIFFICFPFLILLYSYFPEHVTEPEQWNRIAETALNYIPLATKSPQTGNWNRVPQLIWQILITFQATLLGFALRNRYRR